MSCNSFAYSKEWKAQTLSSLQCLKQCSTSRMGFQGVNLDNFARKLTSCSISGYLAVEVWSKTLQVQGESTRVELSAPSAPNEDIQQRSSQHAATQRAEDQVDESFELFQLSVPDKPGNGEIAHAHHENGFRPVIQRVSLAGDPQSDEYVNTNLGTDQPVPSGFQRQDNYSRSCTGADMCSEL